MNGETKPKQLITLKACDHGRKKGEKQLKGSRCNKMFFSSSLMVRQNKLECLTHANFTWLD